MGEASGHGSAREGGNSRPGVPQLLNSYARDHNRRLTEVARDVVERKIPHGALVRRPGTT